MKIIKVKLYTFSELSEDAKQKTIEKYQDINVDYDQWAEWLLDEWKERLEILGYVNPVIAYSGFWSQGDGASFTSDKMKLWQFITSHKVQTKYKKLKRWIESGDITCEIVRNTHQYSHERTVSAYVYIESNVPDNLQALAIDLEKFVDAETEEKAREIYKSLESEYNGMTTDESVAETLEVNEYYFLENGGKIYA